MMQRVTSKTTTLGFRILLAFACIFIVLLIQSIFAFSSSRRLVSIQHNAFTQELRLLSFRDKVSRLRIKMFSLLGEVDPTRMEQIKRDNEALLAELISDIAAIDLAPDLLERSWETYHRITQLHWDFQTTQAYGLMNSTAAEEYEALYGELGALSQRIEAAMEATVARTNTQFLVVTGLLCGVGLVIVAFWGWYLDRSIANPIKQAVHCAQMIADGDLSMTLETHRQDETGQLLRAFRTMTARLSAMLAEIETLIHAVHAGKLGVRGNAQAFTGGWHDLVQGINTVFDAFTSPIHMTAHYIDRMAKGDIPEPIADEYHGDFNAMKQNLNLLILSTNAVTQIAQEIARGNLEVTVRTRSDEDDMMTALAQMLVYLQEAADVAEKIAGDDLQVTVTPKSKQDMLNTALQGMVTNLQMKQARITTSMAEIEAQNWLKSGQAELSNTMRGEQDLPTLAAQIVTYLARYVQAQIGAIYLADQEKALRLMGSYAYAARKGNRNMFALGEGLVGQAALEKRSILFSGVPDDYLVVASALGEAPPRQILIAPFLYEGELKGVLEFGTLTEFTPTQRDFLEQVAENIAIAFHSAQARETMRALLEETQRQAEALEVQQEELRQSNEELETQTRALKASEQQLHVQQEELRQSNESLEEQTHILERQKQELGQKNRELEHAQRLVEEKARDLELSSKYKSEFLANMSHELRTPLNSLLILSKLLAGNKDGNLTEKQIEYVSTIYAAGADLLELINEVLDLSKIEAGRMSLNLEEMSLHSLSAYIDQRFTHMAEENGLTLTIRLADDLPAAIITDRQRVEQILKNLLSNAIKFTSSGGITVSVTRPPADMTFTRLNLTPAHAIAIAVSDTGIGIPAAKQHLIFEAFQQADGTTSRKYGGTGLGLSITRELAKLLGGEICLHSVAGEGSTFTLYLPERITNAELEMPTGPLRDQQSAATLAVQQAAPSTPQPSPADVAGVESIRDDRHEAPDAADRFLVIIEDDPKFAKVLFELARERGFKALIAGDGAAGLQLAYQYIPSAIILDIGLPGLDGWKVMERLKQNPETRHIPVHFISASDHALEAMQMGAIGYLTKPVSLERLYDVFAAIENALTHELKKLLVVEDDDTTRISLYELLKSDHVEITTASTGAEALMRLQTETFDCMVVDLGLGDMTGFQLLERLETDAAIAPLPIIVYTAQELTKDEEVQLKKHAESVIIKGVRSPERLLDEVTLFLHQVTARLPEAQQQRLRRLHDKDQMLSAKTILMVDDDVRNLFALSSVLEEKGLTVEMAESAKDALALLERHDGIDLVLMDIMMPEMDGYEAITHIRSNPQFRQLPIIALTAKAMKGDRQKCIEAGANDYLSKPVDIDKLISLLRVWLY
jgi:CheY-like chemotaxis protein/signal transduction histidine kinase/methyl-accepting chemotaxis protein